MNTRRGLPQWAQLSLVTGGLVCVLAGWGLFALVFGTTLATWLVAFLAVLASAAVWIAAAPRRTIPTRSPALPWVRDRSQPAPRRSEPAPLQYRPGRARVVWATTPSQHSRVPAPH